MNRKTLIATINQLKAPGKGLLAADESNSTCQKRFLAEGIPFSEETRRDYREMLFTTPSLHRFISGVKVSHSRLNRWAGRALPSG